MHDDVGAHIDARARFDDALVQFRVLVGDRPWIERPDAVEHFAPKCSSPYAFELAPRLLFAVLDAADTQRALQRRCDASLKEGARSRCRGAAHVVRPAAIEG